MKQVDSVGHYSISAVLEGSLEVLLAVGDPGDRHDTSFPQMVAKQGQEWVSYPLQQEKERTYFPCVSNCSQFPLSKLLSPDGKLQASGIDVDVGQQAADHSDQAVANL
jgi:hypothetical protein